MDPTLVTTDSGIAYAMFPPQDGGPAPTLLVFALAGKETLATEPYCRTGRLLHTQGWNVVSLDVPGHGADQRAGEPGGLGGWAARVTAGEDFVAAFQERVNDVVEHLVAMGVADPARVAAAGTSRGGFMAFHAAAGNAKVRAVAAFAPVTDLLALSEFSAQEQNPLVRRLALANHTEMLADRATWITIGNADNRVATNKAVALARALAAASQTHSLACDITLRVVPTPGHSSLPEWHDEAAAWFLRTVVSTVRTLPESGHPLATPCTVYPPTRGPGAKPGLVVHLYGSGGSHTFFNLMRPPYARVREALRESGYWVVVPELGPSHWMNARVVATLDAIIGAMSARGESDPDRVHLLGTSMGGGSALIYASQRPQRLRSVLAMFPMTDLAVWVAERPGYLPAISQAHGLDPADAAAKLRDLSPVHRLAAFAEIPVFLLHGDADTVVPVHHSRDFATALRAAGSKVTYHEVPGGGHDDGIATGWQDALLEFIVHPAAST